MPLHALLFCFWITVMEPAFITHQHAVESLPLTAYCSINCEETFCSCLCSSFSRTGTQCTHAFWYQTCSYFLDNMLSYSNLWCHFPVTSWFSLMSSSSSPPISRSSLLVSTVGLSGDICVLFFKMLYHCLILLVPMWTSSYACWSRMNIRCGDCLLKDGVSLLHVAESCLCHSFSWN